MRWSCLYFLLIISTVSFGTDEIEPSKRNYTTDFAELIARMPADVESRIIKGTPAQQGAYPFMVSLQVIVSGNTVFKYCGGTIINVRWILTAAHCMDYPISGKRIINAGIVDAFQYSGSSQTREIIKYVKHPNYVSAPAVVNDIALAKLGSDLVFNRFVQAINLPPLDYFAENIGYGRVIGWGAIHPIKHDEVSNQLLLRDIYILPLQSCRKYWPVHDNMMCLQNKDGSGPCTGDDGGPFIQYIRETPLLVGIASFAPGGSCSEAPYVYSRVARHINFIQQVVREF